MINFGSSEQHREECDKDAVGTDATGEEVRGEEEVFECDGEKNELDEDAVPFAVIFFQGHLFCHLRYSFAFVEKRMFFASSSSFL